MKAKISKTSSTKVVKENWSKALLEWSISKAEKANKAKGVIAVVVMLVAICAYHFSAMSHVGEAVLYLFANNGKLSGRMGGDVKMRNGRSRGFTVPSLVRNAYTSSARSLFAGLSSSFRSLTPDQIAGWNAAAGFSFVDRFAQSHVLKGKQLYISLNSNLSNTLNAMIADAPVPSGILPLPDQTLAATTIVTDSIQLGSSLLLVPAGTSLLISATALQSPGVSRPSQSAFRLIATIAGGSSIPIELIAAYSTKFGGITSGAKLFVQCVSVNNTTGEASAITETVTIIL